MKKREWQKKNKRENLAKIKKGSRFYEFKSYNLFQNLTNHTSIDRY